MSLFKVNYFKKLITSVTAATFLVAGLQAPVYADVVSTDEILQISTMNEKRAEVANFMARADVSERLLNLGVDSADVSKRIDQLTDAEILQMHEQIESMPAGEGGIGFVIGIVVLFMLLDIAGVTDIFPAI